MKKMTVDSQIIVTEIGELMIPEKVTMEEMIETGRYGYVNPNIARPYFEITNRGSRHLYVMEWQRDFSANEVGAAVAALGDKRLALTGDILALSSYPEYCERLRKSLIVCLGAPAIINNQKRILFLFHRGEERGLDLLYFNRRLLNKHRILLVDSGAPDI